MTRIIATVFTLATTSLFLAGCSNNFLVVAPPRNNALQTASATVAQSCMLPPEEKGQYATATATTTLTVEPERADKDKVDGCASVKFRLDAGGNVSEIYVLKEYPVNYDFGSALQRSIQGSKFKTPISTQQWYYIMKTKVYNKNVSH